MNANTVCFSGFSREDEAQVLSVFDQANMRLPKRWAATNEKEAELIVIDMDTVYGHMTWLKANADGKITAAVTTSDRAEANHVLPRPLNLESLVNLLASLSNQAASAIPITRTTGQQAAITPEMLNARSTGQQAIFTASEPAAQKMEPQSSVTAEMPATAPRMTTGTQAAMPNMGQRALKLLDFLKPGVLGGPVKIQLNDAPLLVIDPDSQTYLGSNSLKPYMVYGMATLTESDFIAIDNDEFIQLGTQLGGAQPLARLTWLAGLVGGHGQLLPAYNPNSLFKLSKWPQTEREFPKHFRIATIMMKGPSKLTDIAEQSGATLADVTDFVNANLISGHASV
ncbi:MAG: hypothetical protein ABI644_13045 [Arenimonas sp.]